MPIKQWNRLKIGPNDRLIFRHGSERQCFHHSTQRETINDFVRLRLAQDCRLTIEDRTSIHTTYLMCWIMTHIDTEVRHKNLVHARSHTLFTVFDTCACDILWSAHFIWLLTNLWHFLFRSRCKIWQELYFINNIFNIVASSEIK